MHHTLTFRAQHGPLWPCQEKGRSSLNACLSDRMSRPIMTLLLPSPPTASQMMMADIENGIVETKNLHIFAVCVKLAGWALLVAAAMWHFQSLPLPWGSWMVLQWFTWQRPPAIQCENRVHFGLCRPKCSDPTGDGSSASCGWHGMDTRQGRPERAETGLIGRSPTTSVGAPLERRSGRTRAYPFLSIVLSTAYPRLSTAAYSCSVLINAYLFCLDKRDFLIHAGKLGR